ncbi:UDP-N-acetylglucosamine 1-carboxyvinyltransferase [Pseudoroseomonas deserti]|uniref:UDP-N-acetylglucosamine 1-carboxyvinyltransferase n=1 Tax=Teichococcus deserti TaxID=1817963 RepID=A0A1V2GYC8_9PROT|nr:UDP-N-acetylglucosamine 1-carboxyvinyltransferase [Pseudoroseomonas deserti]
MQEAAPWWRPAAGQRLLIRGGARLQGRYPISGAKNAALPLMVAVLLTPHLVTLRNLPASLDVAVLAGLLQRLGVGLSWSAGARGLVLTACADRLRPEAIEAGLVARMRASVLLLGALLGRCGQARLPLPGGDAIGLRGIDFHLDGLRAMGATITLDQGVIEARAPQGLTGADIRLPFPSVGATENLMLAAVLARSTTTLRNAAREPEIADLARCLIGMGAAIEGLETDTLVIAGGRALVGAQHAVMPDRIELGTLACAAAATDGELLLEGGDLAALAAAGPALQAAGVEMEAGAEGVVARRAAGGLQGIDVRTAPFPGFATDLQSPVMALLTRARGASAVTEAIFEQRFRHVDELRRMGARIALRGQTAWIRGVPKLTGARLLATDVRAGAALVLAALAAEGDSLLEGLDHLDRGYDGMVAKLSGCGAALRRGDF